MKKFSLLLTMAALMVSSSVFAGSIDYLSNQSAKYCMNTAATARTDGADIVAYNPAGTALMGQGFFIDVSNQTLFKPYKQDAKATTLLGGVDESYKQDTPTWILPNVYLAYNFGQMGMGKLAVFGQLGIPAGGGSLKWDGFAGGIGVGYAVVKSLQTDYARAAAEAGGDLDKDKANTAVTSVDLEAEGSSVYYGAGAGVAYSLVDDMISVSAGFRYTMAERSSKVGGNIGFTSVGYAVQGETPFNLLNENWSLDATTEYEYDAKGFTYIFGLDVKPIKELTLAARFETETKLEFEYKQKEIAASSTNTFANDAIARGVKTDPLFYKDGVKANQNLPQILSLGAEYLVMPELTVGLTGTIYWINKADMEGYEDYFNTGYEVAVGATYKVMNELKVGGSVMYTSQSAKDELYESSATLVNVSSNPVLDSIFMGLGATYTVIPNLDLTLALSWVHYLPKDADVALTSTLKEEVSYKKDIYSIALGASYRM